MIHSKNKKLNNIVLINWFIVGFIEIVLFVLMTIKIFTSGYCAVELLFCVSICLIIFIFHILNGLLALIERHWVDTNIYFMTCTFSIIAIIAAIISLSILLAFPILPTSPIYIGFLYMLIIEFYSHPLIRRYHDNLYYSFGSIVNGITRIAPFLYIVSVPFLLCYIAIQYDDITQSLIFRAQPSNDIGFNQVIGLFILRISIYIACFLAFVAYIFNESRLKALCCKPAHKLIGAFMILFILALALLYLSMYFFARKYSFEETLFLDIPFIPVVVLQVTLVVVPCCLLMFKKIRSSFIKPIYSPERLISEISCILNTRAEIWRAMKNI